MANKNKEQYNEYMREYMKRRYHKKRAEAIDFLGGKCVVCGSIENIELDHIDPDLKSIDIAKVWTYSKEKFWIEVKKCQLLCNECHLEKHKSQYPCGTAQRYWRGCKCIDCRAANALHHLKWKEARASKSMAD